MSKSGNGKLGWIATTERWFFGIDELHKNWLSVHARGIYAEQSSRPGTRGGKFPPRLIHPANFSFNEYYEFWKVVTGEKELAAIREYVTDEAYDAIEAAITGRLAWVREGEIPF